MKACKKSIVALAGAILFGVAAAAAADPAPAADNDSGRGMMGGKGLGAMSGQMSWGHGSGMPGARDLGLAAMLQGLDLSDDQRAALGPMDDELFRRQWEITGKMIEAERKLRRQASSRSPGDEQAIAAGHKALRELREQRSLALSQMQEKVDAILTPEQREKLRLRPHECVDGQA